MPLEIDNIPDVSQWQGDIDWSQVPAPIALIKVSDGSGYLDPKANHNYYGAKAAGKAVGMYHFAEWTDPVAEANEFIKAVSPLEEGDVLILDVEAITTADPVAWVNSWVSTVHDATGTWPLLYMSLSTLNAYAWGALLNECGLWVADWAVPPSGTVPTNHVYVMQQYTDSGSVAGIQGHVDLDAWFGSVAQFQAYGYHAPQAAPTPEPAPAPAPPVVPAPVDPAPEVPAPDPAPIPVTPLATPVVTPVTPTPVVVTTPQSDPLKKVLIALVAAAAAVFVWLVHWLHS